MIIQLFNNDKISQVDTCTLYSVNGLGADLPFFCVSATVQYWYRQICSIDRRNSTAFAIALLT